MKRKLKTKILFRSMLMIIIPLVVAGLASIMLSKNALQNTIKQNLNELTGLAAGQVDTTLETTKATLKEVGLLTRLTNASNTNEEKLDILLAKAELYGFTDINATDVNGINLSGVDVSGKDFFAPALSGQYYVSTPYVSDDGKSTIMYISVPLWDGGKVGTTIVGTVYAAVDGDLLSTFTQDVTVGETGKSYIIDENQYYIGNADRSLVYNKFSSKDKASSDSSYADISKMEQTALSGTSAYGAHSAGGKDVFSSCYPIPNTNGWVIVASVEQDEFLSPLNDIIKFIIIIVVVCIIIAAFVFTFIANSITKPVAQIKDAAESLSRGNLDVEVNHKSNDELGQLAEAFNITIETLKQYINEISRLCSEIADGNFNIHSQVNFLGTFENIDKSINNITMSLSDTMNDITCAAEQVYSGSEQISNGAQTLAQGTTEQASTIEELNDVISTLSENIKETSATAIKASKCAETAGDQIDESNKKMGDMINAMENITTKSNEINKIIKTIDDIAFQTNILALNAAVEAARAGLAGKGFAVVADEVRNLASKSAEAAKNTSALISQSIDAVNDGSRIAENTAAALESSVSVTREAITLINNIADTSIEEAKMVEQVTDGITQISTVVQTNAATAEQSAAASEELQGQSGELNSLTEKFTLLNK